MKKILFIIALAFTSLCCSAQGGQVAVLYHGDEIKTFYSSSAFQSAMEQAADGDLITLSPGTYQATDITKAVTIRGAGIGAVDSNTSDDTPLTSISGNVKAIVPSNESGYTLSIEGIEFQGTFSTNDVQDAVFSKIKFKQLSDGSFGGATKEPCGRNLTFFHCVIASLGELRFGGFNYNNCCVNSFGSYSHRNNETFTNCIIAINNSGGFDGNLSGYVVYRNCIFISSANKSLQYTAAHNCVWTGPHADGGPYKDGDNGKPERHNSVIPEGTEIFVEGSFYVLNEEGQKYTGSDGTQVGLYGSDLPFSTKTSYPRIKKLRVSPESTSDGKLKIEFEIDADI